MKCTGMVPNCDGQVSMIDKGGYVYCAGCGLVRRSTGVPCRKLKKKEYTQLVAGEPLTSY